MLIVSPGKVPNKDSLYNQIAQELAPAVVDLPTPRGDRPGSLMVNNGSQRSGFDSRWRHFDFLIRFFPLLLPVLFDFQPTRSTVSCNGMLPAIKFTVNQVCRQSSLPAIEFTCNQSFFLQATIYRHRQILSGMSSPSPRFNKNECFFFLQVFTALTRSN